MSGNAHHSGEFEWQIMADDTSLGPLIAAIETAAEDSGLSPQVETRLQLIIEELVTNCIKYGYPEMTKGQIRLQLSIHDQHLELRFTDDGIPFDPTAHHAPNLCEDIHDRPVGGLGLHLIHQLTSETHYARRDNQNCLTLSMPFSD